MFTGLIISDIIQHGSTELFDNYLTKVGVVMKLTYDFHIHTGLSPCGNNDMTPNNIVNMAMLNELDVIAITDHNSCENVESIIEVAKDTNLIIIPGMEIETREEIHIVCLFETLKDAYIVQKEVYANLPKMKNKTKIFGEQLLFDKEDEIIGNVDRLLSFATSLSIDDVFDLTMVNNGVAIPAHIDRPSYSVISNLGMIPENINFKTLEISQYADYDEYETKYYNYKLIQSSDAHDLGYIGICNRQIEVKNKSIQAIISSLR